MKQRKGSMDDFLNDQALPIPIQIFLWRQISPFIRPKLGKLHEATCMFCQHAPGHHSFEKVLVQNIQFGLSPSLTEAIESIPRWRLIQAALPHVMHASATFLHNRVKDLQSLGAVETKLLYTLHWIVLDAAEECAEADFEKGVYHSNPFYYLFSIPSLSLFIYLFAPIAQHLKESDFQNFRLENGLKIWQALWEFRRPETLCFTAPCKPRPRALGRANVQRGPSDVFVGRKASRDDADSPPSQTVSVSFSDHQTVKPANIEEEVHISQGWLSSPKDTVFPETIPEESSSTEEEHVVIFRLPAVHNNLSGLLHDPSIYTADASMLHHQPGGRITLGCVPLGHDTSKLPLTSSKVTPQVQKMSSSDKDSVESCARSPHAAASSKGGDVLAATFLDVAVLRCLFVSQWQEEGVYWALHYIYNRLRDISDDVSNQSQPRKRSNSLPIPKIEVSIYQSPESKKRESLKNFMEVPELKDNSPNSEIPFYSGVVKAPEEPANITRRASEKVKRRMKMADLKAFVETKLMSKSEKALEKIGQEDPKIVPYEQLEYHRSLDTGDADRPGSALGHNFPPLSPVAKHNKVMAMPSNLVKGKSMPSLRYIGEIRTERRKPFELQYSHPPATQNPIITVTEHTPIPSPDYMKTRQGSLESQLDSVSMQGPHITPERKPSLTRSQTDSNITYVTDEIQEAPGSLCYITKDGDIDFLVVLKAVHFAAMRDNLCWSVRVIEVMLNLVEVLLDVGVLKAGRCHSRSHSDTPCKESSSGDFSTSKEFRNRETSLILGQSQDSPTVEKSEPRRDSSKSTESLTCPHYLILNIIMRVIQQLGCSQGCGSAARGPPAECLRVQARCLLGRARRASPGAAARLLRSAAAHKPLPRLMPFLHSYLAFCVDPSTLLSPLNQKRSNSKSPDVSHGGYATNFGAGLGSAGGHSAEGQVVECMFKILVTRLVNESKDLKIQEDIVLYRDIRHLMTYVKEAHGGVFRVVALSGLLDSADRPNKPDTNMQTTRVIRHIHHSEIEERESDTGIETSFVNDDRTNRKFLFKKRSTSSTCASLLETDVCDDSSKASQSPLGNLRKKHAHSLTPRQSERTLCGMGESTTSNKSTSSKKKLGGIVKWFRKPYGSSSSSYGDSDSPPGEAPPHLMRQASMMPLGGLGSAGRSRGGGGGSRAGKTLRSARRRVEDRLGRLGLRKMGKKRDGSLEESPGNYMSRRSSFELGESARESEVVVLKERRLVEIEPIYSGMLRFSFLLDTCQPGSIPDPHLMAALLDLPHTPVVSRACMLLECAHLVHSCNKGQWPQWMKVDMPNIRPSVPVPGRVSSHPGIRRLRAAGKMFYQWGEALCGRLEEMMQEDRQHVAQVVAMVTDPERQKELLQQDEEEDFLDEASVRLPGGPIGAECPIALRLIACMLLLEITAFLRETYQNLPKISSRASVKERPAPWERIYREANRRWSMALSSMGHSQASAQSLQSIAGDADRKISFVLHEPENESEGSSNATLEDGTPTGTDEKKTRTRVVAPPGRPFLLRRGTQQGSTQPTTPQSHAPPSGLGPPHQPGPLLPAHVQHVHPTGSFKRKSLKLRRNTKDGKDVEEYVVKRADSIQSRRKVSSLSDRSDTSDATANAAPSVGNSGGVGISGGPIAGGDNSGGEESPGVLSDDHDHPPESPDSNDTDDTSKGMPWIKTVVQVINSFNYYCSHQNFCHPFCYKRNMRASSRLIKSVRKIYGEKFGIVGENTTFDVDCDKQQLKKDRRGRKVSDQTSSQTSPIRRKDSVGKKDRLDRSIIDGTSRGDIFSSTRDGTTRKSAPLIVPSPILNYIKTQVRNAFHSPLAILVKGAMVMSEDSFAGALPGAWALLLDSCQEVAASAASLFILAAVKAPHHAAEIMLRDLQHSDPSVRINAILRFQVLWKLRYQVWPRMEEGASLTFKVPPPGIEFTLPSPKIGIESLPIVDPPWSPHVKTKDMEVTLNQERHRSLVTATKTRKKQQTEAIKRALQQREDKRRAEREGFLITTIPITRQAAWEPSLEHPQDDHVEVDEEAGEGLRNTSHHAQTANSLFPSCLCSAVIHIVALLDDAAVAQDGNSVYEVAYQVIWCCLVEDSALFLRYVLERLTRERQEQMFKLLRHLIRFVPKLPQQAAFALYNYIIGYIMFYVRSPHEDGQMLIGTALSVLWMVVHSVHGIMFKDLKQILRKEQCDASILLTANVPSAKKIIVHGPADRDEGGIPSQFPVQEDTQFCQILRESLDFFGIDEPEHKEFFLIDYKTHQIHNPLSYVRDVYFFKRSQYPQLQLVHMRLCIARAALQRQELLHKFIEIGKVHLTWAILKNVDMVVQRVVFLHEELMKLPSFPRKALECDLDLYEGGEMGDQLLGLDVLHKFMWVRLIARMFEAMAGNFAYSGDIHLFLNVLNGAVILHSEDSCILRYVMATYINAAFNFKNIFSINGYLLIMPTLLQIYSNHQTNKLVTTTIEYAVKQFYLMNRKPFILQMFGSVSAILDTDEDGAYGDAHKVQSSCLFNLLLSLETPSPDPLNIAELVKEEKPLKAIDFCYHDENEMVTVLDCISLCVMVVSYSAESVRGYQMLIILEAILPCYVKQIQSPSYNREGKTEKEIIQQLAVAIKTLVNNCEGLSKSYNGPYRSSPEHKGSSQRNFSRGPYSPGFDFDDESHSKYVSDHSRAHPPIDTTNEDSEVVRAEYRRPRDVCLSLVGEFIGRCTVRLAELAKRSGDGKPVELLDTRSHVRLADIAHSLLKVSPYDPESMACRGLQRYMSFILPSTEWSNDAMRPALTTILRRLDKLFLKISKKPSIRRNTDWDAASGLLKGIYETMNKCPYIMHWQHVKTLLNTCQALIVSDGLCMEGCSSATAALMAQPPPPHFCSTVVRLIALQILNTGESYSLEQICGGSSIFPTQEKAENILMNLFMPLCLRVGSGRKDIPCMRQSDISFALTAVLQSMAPGGGVATALAARGAGGGTTDVRAPSLTFTAAGRDAKRAVRIPVSLYRVAFLALKIMLVCFESELITEWGRVARAMRELGKRNEAAPVLWNFLEFVVTHRSPLYILLLPFIIHKLSQPPIGDHERHMQFVIREKVRGGGVTTGGGVGGLSGGGGGGRGALLAELAREVRLLRDELDEGRAEPEEREAAVTGATRRGPEPSRSSVASIRGHGHRTTRAQTLPPQRESVSSGSTTNQVNVSISDGPTDGMNGSSLASNHDSGTLFSSQHFYPAGGVSRVRGLPHSLSQPQHHHSGGHSPNHHNLHHISGASSHPKLRFVSSVEFRHCSGEISRTPLSPASAGSLVAHGNSGNSTSGTLVAEGDLEGDISGGEEGERPPRLQRCKAQSRNTFRLRRSRRNRVEVSHIRLESDGGSSPQEDIPAAPLSAPPALRPSHPLYPLPNNNNSTPPHSLAPYINPAPADLSWDSESQVSQTSSTSGYRESYSLQARAPPPLASPELPDASTSSAATLSHHRSPDGSFSFNGSSSGERTALLGDRPTSRLSPRSPPSARDEDTLI